jgi:hypothetical protein
MTATFEKQRPRNWTPQPIDGREKLNLESEKLEKGMTATVSPVVSCRWTGRLHWLTYVRRTPQNHPDAILAWIEDLGASPFELYREERSKNAPPFYLPVRQWVPLDRLDLVSVPSDVQLHPFLDWRVEQPRYPVSLREDAIVEPETEKLWERLQGKRLQVEGYPRLYHHDRQLYRQRVAIWEDDRYHGSVAVPVEWLAVRDR